MEYFPYLTLIGGCDSFTVIAFDLEIRERVICGYQDSRSEPIDMRIVTLKIR